MSKGKWKQDRDLCAAPKKKASAMGGQQVDQLHRKEFVEEIMGFVFASRKRERKGVNRRLCFYL